LRLFFPGLRFRHPAQLVVGGFALAIAIGTGLLLLPAATSEAGGAPFLTALFTSTSAICVTGLIVVDTPAYWSHFGQGVILGLIQVGGFGIMTAFSLLALVVLRRLRLRSRLIAQAELGTVELGGLRRVLLGVAILSVAFEAATALVLTLRLWLHYDYQLGSAIYHGVFHAISAFNNAGFALWSDSLVRFVTDGWITLAVAVAVVAGGLGFPVWFELQRRPFTPRRWSLHTKLTLGATLFLLVAALAAILSLEWSNEETLGQFDSSGKLLAGFFQAVTPRTAGFNTVDYGAMTPESLLVTDMLMFVGAGSASTAGGIKVTTFALLALIVWAEVRGEPHVNTFGRRVPVHVQRQALAIAFIALNAVVISTLLLIATSQFPLSRALFEALSAFGTVGLSTGITSEVSSVGQVFLVVLMFLGRIGPYTLAVALALRERERRYELPEERPLIG